MSPSTSDDGKKSPPGMKLRQIRMDDALWDNAEIVAKVLRTDRSVLMRDFWRWMTFEEGAMMPRRPARQPEGLKHPERLPVHIQQVTEGPVKSRATNRPRYIIHVDAAVDDALMPLVEAGIDEAASYLDTSPVAISTLDRDHALRMLQVLTDAGLKIVKP